MKSLNRKKLRLWLVLFFLALALPTGFLIHRAYSELKWETFHQHWLQAESLAARIDAKFMQLIDAEEARPFTDYAFLNIAGDPKANFIQRSPLSAFPLESTLPGLIGYFQVDAEGHFSTPLLPAASITSGDYGISQQEQQKRQRLVRQILQILSDNQLVQEERKDDREAPLAERDEDEAAIDAHDRIASSKPRTAQGAFDQLNVAPAQQRLKQRKPSAKRQSIEALELVSPFQKEMAEKTAASFASDVAPVMEKQTRRERSVLPEPETESAPAADETRKVPSAAVRIRSFESEIDPFALSLLDSGHFVLFRKVWRDGQRYIQGALIDPQTFLSRIVQSAFNESLLSRMTALILGYQEEVLTRFSGVGSRDDSTNAASMSGSLLHKTRLSAPLHELELIFTIQQLPLGPGSQVIVWVSTVLILVLCGGFLLIYRLGVRQIALVHQQQDFVSAVSHELKTPLTSIRMYGEILREGWASEEKKKTYYDYIHDESERLSRLIANVLQLARMTRNELPLDLRAMSVSELIDTVRSKIDSQIEQAGFNLVLNCDDEAKKKAVSIDTDAFTQIIINLVDNAIKFSAKAERKEIDISCQLQRDHTLMFTVRDYGPGIPKDQMKKIFQLFFRSENELTRETLGTGIGLALVQQLALVMKGQVEVVNKAPGAEFRVCFDVLESDPQS